jgi:Arc-like DNA binding domain
MARKPNAIVGLQLRFSERLRRKIEEAAKRSGRSMNQEIVARLETSFHDPEIAERVAQAVGARTDTAIKSLITELRRKGE